MDLKITPSGQTIVKPTALGPVANTDTKLLIDGLFQKGRVLAQDGMKQVARNLTDMWDGFLLGKRYLIHDRDPLFTEAVTWALERFRRAARRVLKHKSRCQALDG